MIWPDQLHLQSLQASLVCDDGLMNGSEVGLLEVGIDAHGVGARVDGLNLQAANRLQRTGGKVVEEGEIDAEVKREMAKARKVDRCLSRREGLYVLFVEAEDEGVESGGDGSEDIE